jgi:uncharacterized delta-60 repeat protein
MIAPAPVFSRLAIAAVLVAWTLASAVHIQAADTSFRPQPDGNVYAVLIQPDGKIVIGGGFKTVFSPKAGVRVDRKRLARFNPDGSLDETFTADFNNDVMALALQSDGRLLVGGRFTQYDGASASYSRNGLARLHADGSLDLNYFPQFTGGSPSQSAVSTLSLQSDGKLLVGGAFTSVQSTASSSAVARSRLARLDANGVVDSSFNPSPNNTVLALAVQRDGRILVGGGFTQFTPNGGPAVARQRVARLNVDGAVDMEFDVAADNRVLGFAIEADGSVLLAGEFRNVRGRGESSVQQQLFIARLSSDGTRDQTFAPQPNAYVSALAVQRDGKILLAGNFTQVRSATTATAVSRTRLARITREGSVDLSFTAQPDAAVAAIALQPDGHVVFGGYFSSLTPVSGGIVGRLRAARVQSDGTPDTVFGASTSGRILATARRTDGSWIVGGNFTNLGGVTRRYLAAIQADGTIDPAFAPEFNAAVSSVLIQADGRILVGGGFTTVNGAERTYLARLNADGTLDESYDPKPRGAVNVLLASGSDKVYVGGSFVTWEQDDGENDDDDGDGITTDDTRRAYVARLNLDGTIDGWKARATGAVTALALQSDGKLIVGGAFTSIADTTRYYLARLNTDVSIDTSFNPTPNSTISSIVLQSDGKILIAGSFSTLQLDDGENDDDDGDGIKTDDADRVALARLNANGTLDRTFVNPRFDGQVDTMFVQSDGRIVAAGRFLALKPGADEDPTNRRFLVRLEATGQIDSSFEWQLDEYGHTLAPLDGGGYLLGGGFITVYTTAGTIVDAGAHLVRFDESGALDTNWKVRGVADGNEYVTALAAQTDGRWLVGGQFKGLSGGNRANLARLNADGTLDSSFSTATDGAVHAVVALPRTGSVEIDSNLLAWITAAGDQKAGFSLEALADLSGYIAAVVVQPDGGVLIGGSFFSRSGATGRNLLRLRTDGTVDPSFSPSPDGTVSAMVYQPDGKLLVAGAFTSIAGQARQRIARFDTDGTLDSGFISMPGGPVRTMVVKPDGAIVIGGTFVTFDVDDGEGDDDDGDGAKDDDIGRAYIARLASDGSLDRTYTPALNGGVNALLLEADGRMLVGGGFTTVTPSGSTTASSRNYFARLNADGTLADFDPNFNGAVTVLAKQSDGRLVVGGAFSTIQVDDGDSDDDDGDGTSTDDADRLYLARFNADDSFDRGFKPTPNGQINAMVLQSDDSIVVGGLFEAFWPNDTKTGIVRRYLARLKSDGTVDETYNPSPNAVVYAIALHNDGSALVGGAFTAVETAPRMMIAGEFSTVGEKAVPRLARVQPDGNPDQRFTPTPNGAVYALAPYLDGRVLVGGAFTQIAGAERPRVARLLADGSLDTSYAPQFNGTVRAIALRADGVAYVGGSFTSVGGQARGGVARVTSTGALDPSFVPALGGSVVALATQSDGRILVAGDLTANGTVRRIARLNTDGSLDAGFSPHFDGDVRSIALQADGRILVGGSFTRVNDTSRRRVALLNSDGSLAHDVGGVNGPVSTLVFDRFGQAVVGGSFSELDGVARYLIGRLGRITAAADSIAVGQDRASVTWYRGGGAPEVASVVFSISTEANRWVRLGTATRLNGSSAWHWSGAGLPASGAYSVRARATVPANQYGSSGVLETIWQFAGTTPAGYGYPAGSETVGLSSSSSSSESSSANSKGSSNGGGSSGGGSTGESDDEWLVDVLGTRLINVSTRAQLAADEVLISGFVIAGGGERQVLLRAVGPGLATYGVPQIMTAPTLRLYTQAGELIASNSGWGGDDALRATMARVGAFPLQSGSEDAVLAPTLAPGAYSIHVSGGGGGVVLAEVYDAGSRAVASRLVNLSTRGQAGTGSATLIGGFVIHGDQPQRLLIRGVGPTLANYGVSGVLADPQITVYNSAGAALASNDNWGAPVASSDGTLPPGAAELALWATRVGAAPLPTGSRDAAVALSLPPGPYSVGLTGAESTTGVALIEVFEIRE